MTTIALPLALYLSRSRHLVDSPSDSLVVRRDNRTPLRQEGEPSICVEPRLSRAADFHARKRPSSRAIPFYMTLLRQRETSRISSRGKGSVCSKGGGDSRTLSSDRRSLNGNTITTHDRLFLRELTSELTSTSSLPTWYHRLPGFLRATSDGHAACMIIEDYPPTPPATAKPRQYSRHQDTTQRFLNLHLVLPKHRTSKFSSNRHRKLQPFRET